MRILGKQWRIDRGEKAKSQPAFRRALRFEQMEERLTLSTAAPVFSFVSDASLEGGWITVDSWQVQIVPTRGVVDSDGLSGFEFSDNLNSGLALSYQSNQIADVATSNQHDRSYQFGTNLNANILGGGLKQVIPIAPMEQDPPMQPDGGHIQIARLFDPSFERHAGREAVLATSPSVERVRHEAEVRQEFAPAQGREMAFEVASTSPMAFTRSGRVSESRDLRVLEEDIPESNLPSTQPMESSDSHGARHVPAERQTTQRVARREEIPAERISRAAIPAITLAERREIHVSAEDGDMAVRDQVFAEWPVENWRQGPSVVEPPTAPLAKDRQQQVSPTIVLSGAALLSAGIHFARAHSRETLKEIEQLEGRNA